MNSITIRNIDDGTKNRLQLRAAARGRSMEAEARDILRAALSTEVARLSNMAKAIQARFARLGGVDVTASATRDYAAANPP